MLNGSFSQCSVPSLFLGRDPFVSLDNSSLLSSQAPGHKSSSQWKVRLPPLSEWNGMGLNFKSAGVVKKEKKS